MTPRNLLTRGTATVCLTAAFLFGLMDLLSHAAPPASPATEVSKGCADTLTAKVQVDPKLQFKFFTTTKTSRPWHIVGDEANGLDDTVDGSIDEEDLLLVEHTSACISTHQGKHLMVFCEAKAMPGGGPGLTLFIHGGVPAYTSSLTVDVDAQSGNFTCGFDARYPSPTPALSWRITKKALLAKSLTAQPGHRFHAWISVEFDEVWTENGTEQKRSYKIEGPIKPVMQHAPKKE